MENTNTASDLENLQDTLNYRFKDATLLLNALTHPSYAYESQDKNVSDNGRLEFLGDSVLGLVTASHLFDGNSAYSEGDLTRHRSILVNKASLAKKARDIGLERCLLLGKGEEKTGGRNNATNLAGALEAVIAAIYLDGGYAEAQKFILARLV